jgi:hypothetical protein
MNKTCMPAAVMLPTLLLKLLRDSALDKVKL